MKKRDYLLILNSTIILLTKEVRVTLLYSLLTLVGVHVCNVQYV